jgi:hypothetical protein
VLDLDNWKLKNRIKEVLEERLMEKTMDYDEFKTLYPDTMSCYRFLETIKWKKDFHCRKCSNTKYFDGVQKFSKRCTRCGYNESITAYTIFHNVKFPIEKAFFVTYLSVTDRKSYTLEALSNMLSIRINTIWGFKNKVKAQIAELEKKGRIPNTSKWHEIILTDENGKVKSLKQRADLLQKP